MKYLDLFLTIVLMAFILSQSSRYEAVIKKIDLAVYAADSAQAEVVKLRREMPALLKPIQPVTVDSATKIEPLVVEKPPIKKQQATWPPIRKNTCFRYNRFGEKIPYDCTTNKDLEEEDL